MSSLPVVSDVGSESRPIRVRGHTLLCLHGYRGFGYSPAFVEQMSAIHQQLMNHPDQLVEVIDASDTICGACPHHAPTGCSLNTPNSEEDMRAQDRDVLNRLGLQAGERIRWKDVQRRIAAAIDPDDLSSICGSCRWRPLGYCREGLMRLRARQGAQP